MNDPATALIETAWQQMAALSALWLLAAILVIAFVSFAVGNSRGKSHSKTHRKSARKQTAKKPRKTKSKNSSKNKFKRGKAERLFVPTDPLPAVKVRFLDPAHINRGNFGEALTSLMLTKDGWKQYPTKLAGGQGIDGLFARETPEGDTEFLITETKTGAAGLATKSTLGKQMSDAWVLDRLDQAYALGLLDPDLVTHVQVRIRKKSPLIRKELWRHDLVAATTSVYTLDTNANEDLEWIEPGDPEDPIQRRAHRRLIEGLSFASEALDRKRIYVQPDHETRPNT